MAVDPRLLWALGMLSLCGLFFWVSLLLPSSSTPRMRDGWRWLQWRPLPYDLPTWMGLGVIGALLLQYLYVQVVLAGGERSFPPGIHILVSILCFQGFLTAILFFRMRMAKIDVPEALGMDSPFQLREVTAGFVGYCMSLPLVVIAGLMTQGLYHVLDWEIKAQPMLDDFTQTAGWMNWLTLFFLVGFIGPLLEEVVFRGFLFSWFRQKMGIHLGLWMQAVVFAFVHQYGAGFFPLMALSLVLGLAYVYSQRLMVCVWIHSFFNVVTLVNVVLSGELS